MIFEIISAGTPSCYRLPKKYTDIFNKLHLSWYKEKTDNYNETHKKYELKYFIHICTLEDLTKLSEALQMELIVGYHLKVYLEDRVEDIITIHDGYVD